MVIDRFVILPGLGDRKPRAARNGTAASKFGTNNEFNVELMKAASVFVGFG